MNMKPQQKYLFLYRCDARCIQNEGRWQWNGNLSENNYISVLGLLNKHHRLKRLNSSNLLALISRGWKSKIKVSAGWFLLRSVREGSVPQFSPRHRCVYLYHPSSVYVSVTKFPVFIRISILVD